MQNHSGFSPYNWGPNNLTIKVVNLETGRIDVHKNVSKEEADWIALSPNLEVELMEVSLKRNRKGIDEDRY